jgi:hypothetical protein
MMRMMALCTTPRRHDLTLEIARRPRVAADRSDGALDEGDGLRASLSSGSAPSRSCTLAGRSIAASSRPSASASRWRQRPVTFLPAS